MGKQAVKRVGGVPGLLPDERILEACWTMGSTALTMVGVSGGRGWRVAAEQATHDLDGQGMAAAVGKHNGILALTDQRLLWCEVKTALGKPKNIDAAFPPGDVADISWGADTLAVKFRDGSSAGLYCPKGEHPDNLIAWFNYQRENESPTSD